MDVSVLGFGASEIGYNEPDQGDVERLLNEALDSGLNVIDTAECYLDSEERIGKAVGHRRDEFFLFTKVGHSFPAAPDLPDWHPELLAQSIDHSLKALKTDCLDLVQLHTCGLEVLRAGEAAEVLVRARKAGKTRFIGYSGDGEEAVEALKLGVFDSLQTSLNIADQQAIDLTLPLVRQQGLGLIVKRPIANAAWKRSLPAETSYYRPYWDRLQVLAYTFLTSDTAVETALRFVLTMPEPSTLIVGTSRPGRWTENATLVAKGPLPADEFESIRRRWREVAAPDWIGKT